MVHVNVYEAKTNLSRLLAQVEAGEEVVLSRSGKPIARIVPWTEPASARRSLGLLAGKIRESADAWDPVVDDVPSLMAAEPLFPEG